MKRNKKSEAARLLAAFYLAALLIALVSGGVRLAKSRYYQAKGNRPCSVAELADFELRSILPAERPEDADPETEGQWFVSTDADPQMLISVNGYLDTVVLNMERLSVGYAPVLYWTNPGQADFSEAQAVYGKKIGPDRYEFDLKGQMAETMRIDPDSVGGVIACLKGVEINPARSAFRAFCPSAKTILLLLALPLLAATLVLEVKAILKR